MTNALILTPEVQIAEPDGSMDYESRLALAGECTLALVEFLQSKGYKVYDTTTDFDCSMHIPDDWNGERIG